MLIVIPDRIQTLISNRDVIKQEYVHTRILRSLLVSADEGVRPVLWFLISSGQTGLRGDGVCISHFSSSKT
jgi:hypothetical protein